jgi:hypothetical protein
MKKVLQKKARVKQRAKMKQTKGDQETDLGATQSKEKSVFELAEMLSKTEDVDEALRFEEMICKKISESNVSEIKDLFSSKYRYCNVAALRILSDSGRVGLSNANRYVDPLFEHDDLVLKRLCLSLIEQHNYYHTSANTRMAQLGNFPDEPIKRSVRVWLLWRTVEELKEFSAAYQPLDDQIEALIGLIISYKSRKIGVEDFFSNLSTLDDIAFREYTRLSKQRAGRAHTIFHKK